MPFEIHPATLDDVPELVRVYQESLADNVDFLARYNEVPPQVLEAYHYSEFEDYFEHSCARVFKVMDIANGVIAGCSVWEFPWDEIAVPLDQGCLDKDSPCHESLEEEEDSPGQIASKEEKLDKRQWCEVGGLDVEWFDEVNVCNMAFYPTYYN